MINLICKNKCIACISIIFVIFATLLPMDNVFAVGYEEVTNISGWGLSSFSTSIANNDYTIKRGENGGVAGDKPYIQIVKNTKYLNNTEEFVNLYQYIPKNTLQLGKKYILTFDYKTKGIPQSDVGLLYGYNGQNWAGQFRPTGSYSWSTYTAISAEATTAYDLMIRFRLGGQATEFCIANMSLYIEGSTSTYNLLTNPDFAVDGLPALKEVENLTATQAANGITLSWAKPSSYTNYLGVNIYDNQTNTLLKSTNVQLGTFLVDGYAENDWYKFKIKTVDIKGNESEGVIISNGAFISNLTISKEGRVLDDSDVVTAGEVTASAIIDNPVDNKTIEVCAIIALYQDGILKKIGKAANITVGKNAPIDSPTTISNTIAILSTDIIDTKSKYVIKAFMWDYMEKMSPIVKMVKIPQDVAVPLSTQIQQTKRGNIFFETEPKKFKLYTNYNNVEIVVKDYWGNEVIRQTEDVSRYVKYIDVPVNKKGYFEFIVYGKNSNNNLIELKRTPFAIISTYDFGSVTESDFGICAHLRWDFDGWQRDLVNEISWMGAKSIRDDFGWSNVEKTKGVYTISPSPQREMMINNNISFMFSSGYENILYDGGATSYTDAGRLAFANYQNGVIENYGSNLKYLDVYNEFWGGFGDRGSGPADSKAEYYYPLLKKTYEEVKRKHPEVMVLGNTVTDNKPGWYESLLKLGAANYMDATFLHSYFNGETPEYGLNYDFTLLSGLHQKYTPNKEIPIWITETGASTANDAKTEREQAQYVVRTYAIAKSYGAKKIYWYDFMDDGIDPNEREDGYGFIRNAQSSLGAFTPKPSYVSYAVMARQLTGKTLINYKITSDGVYKYVFSSGNDIVSVLWTLGTKVVNFTTNTPLEVTDIMGEHKTYSPVNGVVSLTLSENVLYVKGTLN